MLADAGLVVVGVLFALGLLEVGVRLVYGNNPPFYSPQVKHENRPYGYKPIPNQRGVYTIDKPVSTNSVGFRDDEWSVERVPGRRRVMTIGDSFTFGNGVRVEESYSNVLERRLRERGLDVEVFNASAGGWGVNDLVDYYVAEGSAYRPDFLVYGFYFNDYMAGPPVGERVFTDGGRVEGRPAWLRWLPYEAIFVLKRSALVTLVRDRLGALTAEDDDNNRMVRDELDVAQSERVRYTYSKLRELNAACEASGTRLVIAAIPSINLFWQGDPDK